MVVMIVACPVCGSSAQAEGEGVYRNDWDHSTNPPTYRVMKQDGCRCGECGRLYTTGHGTAIDADLIVQMQKGRERSDG